MKEKQLDYVLVPLEKGWLKTTEDEIEISDLSLKDIIVLGEYRELTSVNVKRAPAAIETQTTNTEPAIKH
ncbi:hypothetical protein AgCh_035627 [Apium graveolens]